MNAEELANVKQKLRDFTAANGMQWVLNEVDEAVSLGISEIRTLRQATQQGRVTYEDVTGTDFTEGRTGRSYRREEFIGRRPMTELEQVELLIQSLRRVLVDLDDVADASVSQLANVVVRKPSVSSELTYYDDIQVAEPPEVSEIAFAPDEGSNYPAVSIEAMRHPDRVALISGILTELESEIRS
jgi:hypothetical protein